MLDRDHPKLSVARMIAALPCRVQLPDSLRERFETTGVAPATMDDRRRHPRLRCRSTNNRVAVQRQASFPALPHAPAWVAVYLADISRGGFQVIAGEQLFPGERLRLLLPTGAAFDVEAIRCRRLGETCFSIGTRLVASLA